MRRQYIRTPSVVELDDIVPRCKKEPNQLFPSLLHKHFVSRNLSLSLYLSRRPRLETDVIRGIKVRDRWLQRRVNRTFLRLIRLTFWNN